MTVWRNKRLSAVLAAGAAALVTVTGAAPASAGYGTPGAPGLGDRLYPLLGNGGYDVRDYALDLRYPAKDPAQAITGSVTVSAVATQALSRFDLDFGGGSVGAVTVDGRSARFARDGDELVITPRRALRKGERFTVTVSRFTATPVQADADSPVGFVTTPDGTVLAGQPNTSHLLFPSNDHPRDKATYTISLTVPEGWTAVASGRNTRTTTRNGYVTSTYRESAPMASELVQVVAGDYVVQRRPAAGGVPIRDVVPRRFASTLLPRADVERSQVTWMQGKVGKYPFENYGSLVIDANLGFALETQTLSLYDTGLFARPAYVLDPIMTHELAHQWFGDSVAPWQWSDVWQNEGHATWYELVYAAEKGYLQQYAGAADLDAYFKGAYASGDRYRARYGPVAAPLRSGSIWDVFNPNVYDGGALVLYALRQQVGAATFERIERAWVARYEGKSASTAQFVALASQVAHRDLRAFLNDWLYGTKTPAMPGHPDWTVTPATAPVPAAVARTEASVTTRLQRLGAH
ncbi:M1 family metallopeptidase [Actinoplanes sp. RD1]|uniref:M1 family metallopeptidase n=1 Tax=Actinoplanes sp. RD1 TaxID=3064538 RepID=UPI002741CC44|nr:M1 family metallopeptidase [Actinoplanes sp. RD1]